ncbi:GrpB family protein [bacterium]|nr:GrpB family protein [bacterium]
MPDSIIIVPYDPEWPRLFAELGARLRRALGPVALRIDHIGSTSIPGMAAKPVIDVVVSVASFEPLATIGAPLEGLGFVHRASNPDLTKRYFREAPGERRTHIHVRRAGSWSEQFALLFRDYMRAHDADCRWYEAIKRQLAEQYRDDRQGYTNAKAPYLWEIMQKADPWAQATGWTPGPSDA